MAGLRRSHELLCIVDNFLSKAFFLKYVIDQSNLMRLIYTNCPAGDEELESSSLADDARQTLRTAHAWQQSKIYLGQPEHARATFCDPDVAGQGDLHTSTHCV